MYGILECMFGLPPIKSFHILILTTTYWEIYNILLSNYKLL